MDLRVPSSSRRRPPLFVGRNYRKWRRYARTNLVAAEKEACSKQGTKILRIFHFVQRQDHSLEARKEMIEKGTVKAHLKYESHLYVDDGSNCVILSNRSALARKIKPWCCKIGDRWVERCATNQVRSCNTGRLSANMFKSCFDSSFMIRFIDLAKSTISLAARSSFLFVDSRLDCSKSSEAFLLPDSRAILTGLIP